MTQQPRGRHSVSADRGAATGGRITARAAALVASLLCGTAVAQEAAADHSLVVARQAGYRVASEVDCVSLGGETLCPEHPSAWFDNALAIAGRPVPASLDTSSERGRAGYYAPVLVVLLHAPDAVARVVAQAEADPSGLACLSRAEMDRIGWHPSGPDILDRAGGTCADLSSLAALPVPAPLVVRASDDFRLQVRRSRRRP
jgi:hypothetical protein